MGAEHFDLIVIGGGSGGLACAQRAAEYGAKAVVIESGRLGGTCVNVGCVPKKVMFNAASLADSFEDAQGYGFDLTPSAVDWATLKQRRDAYVLRLNGIYERNLANKKVEYVAGRASFVDASTVTAAGRQFTAPNILIATGGKPALPMLPGADLGISSDGFFDLATRPTRVAVVGSGYIACEFAGVFASLGSEVQLFIRKNQVLGSFRPDAGSGPDAGNARGRHPHPGTGHPQGTAQRGQRHHAWRSPMVGVSRVFDCVVWAIGRHSDHSQLNLKRAGVHVDAQDFIITDKYQATSAQGIYAVGDVTGRAPLTPVAIAAGRRLSDRLFGGKKDRKQDYSFIPTVIFHPPADRHGGAHRRRRRVPRMATT